MNDVDWLPGRWALAIASVAYGVWWVVEALTLPAQSPGKMGFDGQVTRWDSKASSLTMSAVVGALIALVFWLMPLLLKRIPSGLVNVPNPDYWRRPENYPEAVRRISDPMSRFGAATLVLLISMQVVMWAVALGKPLPTWAPVVALVLYLAYVVSWIAKLYRQFRVPGRRSAR